MDETKELSKNARNNIVDLHMVGMSNNSVSKKLGKEAITAGAIIWK